MSLSNIFASIIITGNVLVGLIYYFIQEYDRAACHFAICAFMVVVFGDD